MNQNFNDNGIHVYHQFVEPILEHLKKALNAMENYSELCSRQLQEVTWTHLELRSRLAELWQRVNESKIPQRGYLSLELGGPGLVWWTRTWAWARWLLNGFTWIQSARTLTA